MNKNVLALTLLVALTSFVPAAQAGFLCEDEDGEIEICLKRLPIKSLIPQMIPSLPKSTAVEKRANDADVVAPRPAPKAADANARIVEKPTTARAPEIVRVPDIARVCKKYFPTLGEMLPIPCDD